MDAAGSSSIRLSAKQALALARGKDKATAIQVGDSPSPISVHSSSDEEEDEFEEVAIPAGAGSSSMPATPGSTHFDGMANGESLETVEDGIGYLDEDEEDDDEESQVIRLEIGGETPEEKAKRIALAMRKKPLTSKDRAIRLEVHKMHAICLLASTRIRNRWASNLLLQARLLSLLPHPLQASFVIPPKRFPDRAQRSRLFLDALQSLASWWSQSFFDISDPSLGLRTRTWDETQEVIDRLPRLDSSDFIGGVFARPKQDKKGKGKGKAKDELDPLLAELTEEFGNDRLRSVNSVMKKALQQEGSRDVSALLFVALARACGLGARLVVSLQTIPWRAEKVVVKKSKVGAGNGGRSMASRQGMGPDGASEEDEMEEVPIPGVEDKAQRTRKNNTRGAGNPKMKDPADLYRLRKQKPPPQTLAAKPKRKKKEDMSNQPPVFWAEVFSRSDQRWIPVDPLTGVIRKKGPYEPSSDNGPVRMVYVVAFEEDGYARDVTLRYAKNFGARTCKLRAPQAKPGEPDWWTAVTGFLQRPLRLNRDDKEDAEFNESQKSEGMPLHMNGFKDHPLYVLERHLKREEVILPKREVGKFKGESVYRRSNVLQTKTAENWMRSGRQIRPRQEPLKWVKQRVVTLEKRRAQELAVQEGQEPILQGLYAEYQTELYKPPPIKDGIIPQNAFGNIDLYVPSMLPEGAVHLEYKSIAKVAKQLGVSYAEAVTSFEFKKQRAIPVITGIVVAIEKRETVLEAYWESAAAAEEREKARREDRALKRWVQLVNGLRVRLRLRAEYGTGEDLHGEHRNPMADADGGQPSRSAASIIAGAHKESTANWHTLVHERLPSPIQEDTKPDVEAMDVEPEAAPESEPEPEPQVPTPKEPTPPMETTRSGRPKRGVNAAAKPPPPPSSGAATPTRIILRVPVTPRVPAAPTSNGSKGKVTKGRAKGRGKRKADSDEEESEAEDTDWEEVPKTRRGRAAAAAAPPPAPTRTLRSRAPKP